MKGLIMNIKNIKNTFMQFIIAILIINVVYSYQISKEIDINPYKSIKSIKNSLFREKDSGDRMSSSIQGVPQIIKYLKI
jgi:hypothetical protein